MGCKDTLGPYWAYKPGQGPVSYSDGLRPGGRDPTNWGLVGGRDLNRERDPRVMDNVVMEHQDLGAAPGQGANHDANNGRRPSL